MPNKSRTVRSYWALFSRGICDVVAMPWVQSGLVPTVAPALPVLPVLPLPAVEPEAPGLLLEPGPDWPDGSSIVPVVQPAARAAANSIPLRKWNIALTSQVLIMPNPFHDSGAAESPTWLRGSLMFDQARLSRRRVDFSSFVTPTVGNAPTVGLALPVERFRVTCPGQSAPSTAASKGRRRGATGCQRRS